MPASTPADAVDTGTHLRSALVWLCRTHLIHSHSSFSLLFPHPVGSRLSPSPSYRTPPFSSFGAWPLARLLIERTPLPSFFHPPLKLAQGAHHGRCSPHLMTRQCFPSTPPPLPGFLGAPELATFTPHPCNQQSAQQTACKLKPRAQPVATHPRSFSRTLVPSSQRHAAVSSAPPPTTHRTTAPRHRS